LNKTAAISTRSAKFDPACDWFGARLMRGRPRAVSGDDEIVNMPRLDRYRAALVSEHGEAHSADVDSCPRWDTTPTVQ